MSNKKTTTIKTIFRQMFNGLPLGVLYEIEDAIIELVDEKEASKQMKKVQLIELVDENDE